MEAYVAILISLVSAAISVGALITQRRHNRATIKPIPGIRSFSEGTHSCVVLTNHGLGPLTVVSVIYKDMGRPFNKIIHCLPQIDSGLIIEDVSEDLVGVSVPVQGKTVIFRVNRKAVDAHVMQDIVASKLRYIIMVMTYTDVHGNTFKPFTKRLDDFPSK